MNSANQSISQNNQNGQINPNNQMDSKEIKLVHYSIQPIEVSIKPVISAENMACIYDDSSEYSSYSSCMEWSDSTEDLIDMLDEQPDHLWDLSSDSEC